MSWSFPRCTALLLVCFCSTAWAAPARVLMVPWAVTERDLETPAAELSQLLVTALAQRSGRFELRMVQYEPRRPALPQASSIQDEARPLLVRGQALLKEMRFDEAAAVLEKGVAVLVQGEEHPPFDALFATQLSLAIAAFRAGDENRARATLESMARLDPSRHDSARELPPVFVRELQQARTRVQQAPQGSLSVSGMAEGQVFLNGRALGRSPLTLAKIPAGAHYVSVVNARGQRFGQKVEVEAGEQSHVFATFGREAMELEALVQASLPPRSLVLDPHLLAGWADYAETQGAEYVVLGALARERTEFAVAAVLLSVRSRSLLPLRSGLVDASLEQAGPLVSALAEALSEQSQNATSRLLVPFDFRELLARAGADDGLDEGRPPDTGHPEPLLQPLVPSEESVTRVSW